MMRLPIPTCGAASPMPGAACMVANMSSMSCWVSGSFSSRFVTFLATLWRMGSGSKTMRLIYAIHCPLQYILRQVLVLHNIREALLHVGRVDDDRAAAFRRLIADAFEHALEHRVQSSRADVLG